MGKLTQPEGPQQNTPPHRARSWAGVLACLGLGTVVAYSFWPNYEDAPPRPSAGEGWVYEQETPEAGAENKLRALLDKAPPIPEGTPPALPATPSLPPDLPGGRELPERPGTIPVLPPSLPSLPDIGTPLPDLSASDLPPLPPGVVPGFVADGKPLPLTPIFAAGPGPVVMPPGGADAEGDKRPPIDRPLESRPPALTRGPAVDDVLYVAPFDPPIGYAGPSGILPRATQSNAREVPVEDRWRIGFPAYDRYGKGFPDLDDYLYRPGSLKDPFNQNVLKGDYPILGQHIFFEVTGTSRTLAEPRTVPTATTPFESTARAFSEDFFGEPEQLGLQQFFVLSLELFHGDAAFRPVDWRVRVTPVFNINHLAVDEVAQVNPDVRRGSHRTRSFLALQEWFAEVKLADLGPNYDFVSARVGSQFFNSDFRGFIFTDTNRAARIFGTRNSNREQFNVAYFAQLEKDTNSELNTFKDRDQGVFIANYFIQDTIWPGYTAQFSFHYNRDEPSFHFDRNNVLVRPDPVGVAREHGLDAFYLGWTGDGHINRINVNHALYYAFGRDSLNPIANRGQDISAAMGALELSYDRDYVRFRSSLFWASGDDDPRNGHATGFDAIFDNPNFVGGEFSYWQRQQVRLFGVNLVNRGSLLPNLRSSKIQGQSNFVNPGLFLTNAGVDIDITPRFRMINNVNFLWFDHTAVLKQYVYADKVDQAIGTDISMGFEYRPLLSNNVIIKFGASTLLPSQGFYDLYNQLRDSVDPLYAAFVDIALTY